MTIADGRTTIAKEVERLFLAPLPGRQGVHLDPLLVVPPDKQDWSADHREAFESAEMSVFADALRFGDLDVRKSVLGDLAAYYEMSPEAALDRCLNWEEWSNAEWRASDRSTPEGMEEFYQSVRSWSFDLLWYAYLQTEGHGFPASVATLRFANAHCLGKDHLDFGSGAGVTAQLFIRSGYTSTLADVSRSLLDFARWRLDRRGDSAQYIHLANPRLPPQSFDIITAIDTLVHVPDVAATARELHDALRPGGWLLANFDVRDSREIPWHLHESRPQLEHDLLGAGFVPRANLGAVTTCYQRVDPATAQHRWRVLRSAAMLPLRRSRSLVRRLRVRSMLRNLTRALASKR